MEQKIGIALVLLAACALLLYGCAGASNGTNAPAQGNPQVNTQNGAAQFQPPTTGVASLSDNDTTVSGSDQDGAAYTELPVDDGTDSPVNSS